MPRIRCLVMEIGDVCLTGKLKMWNVRANEMPLK